MQRAWSYVATWHMHALQSELDPPFVQEILELSAVEGSIVVGKDLL